MTGVYTLVEKAGVISIRDKTDILTFRLLGHAQVQRAGLGPDLLFGQMTNRKESAFELGLIERKQEVGLILIRICPA